jgi:hypothetical protein
MEYRKSACWQQTTGAGIVLSESDVARRRRCTEGARIVFIGTSGLGSMVMRGKLTHSVLKQTFSEHGVKSSYVAVSDPLNSTAGGGRDSAMLEGHFDQIGEPSACIILKYSVAWVGAACRCAQHVRCVCTAAHRTCTACTLHVRWDDQASDLLACRRRGAIVLVDNIDNYRAFKRKTITNEHYAAMDAMLVQTRTHASLLASWGHTAVVLPHSHGEPPVLTRTPWCLRTGLLRAVRTWGTWQLVCHGTYVVCVPASGVPYVPRAVWCTTGNLQHWSVAGDVRPSVRGVGFVVSVRPAHSNRC